MKRGSIDFSIESGSVDDTNNILRFKHNGLTEYQGNIASDKSVSRSHVDIASFSLSYRPPDWK